MCSVCTSGVSNLTLPSLLSSPLPRCAYAAFSILAQPHVIFTVILRRSLENEVLREGERDLYVKQTYSVHRNDVPPDEIPANSSGNAASEGKKEAFKRKPRKWHLSECSFCCLFWSLGGSFFQFAVLLSPFSSVLWRFSSYFAAERGAAHLSVYASFWVLPCGGHAFISVYLRPRTHTRAHMRAHALLCAF